jgi:hypothetical protein
MLRVVRRNSQCFLRLVESGMTRLGDSSRQLATGSQLRRDFAIRDGSECPPKQSTSQTVPLQECLSAHYITYVRPYTAASSGMNVATPAHLSRESPGSCPLATVSRQYTSGLPHFTPT